MWYMVNITVLHNELDSFVDDLSGFSFLIEADGKRVVFDVSLNDDIFVNAASLGLELSGIDYVVLSHGHFDHTDGLQFMDENFCEKILAHPACFEKKFFEGEGEIGCSVDLDFLKARAEVLLTTEPYWITPGKLVFLGEIPRKNDFEGKEPIGFLSDGSGDYVLDDSAIVLVVEQELIVISGCSHSGICNIIEYAKKVTGVDNVHAVFGGFHLFDKVLTDKTVEYLKDENIVHLYPAHCLDEYAFGQMESIGAKRIRKLQKFVF